LFALAMLMASSIALAPLTATPWHAIAIACVSIGGGGAAYTVITADMMRRIPSANVSFAGGFIAGAQSLALVVANPLVGRAVDRHGDYNAVAWCVGAWVVPGALVWLFWDLERGTMRVVRRNR
jgi:predicted MFS family arabinose efflux permease